MACKWPIQFHLGLCAMVVGCQAVTWFSVNHVKQANHAGNASLGMHVRPGSSLCEKLQKNFFFYYLTPDYIISCEHQNSSLIFPKVKT